MKTKFITTLFIFVVCAMIAHAQETTAPQNTDAGRVPLSEQPVALDASGNRALAARLVTPPAELAGTPPAPIRNVRFQMQNVSGSTYLYASGWVVFFGTDGARCGAGQWTANVLAPNETIETDAPGLRLACAPVAWRIEATNLIAPGLITPLAPERAVTQRAEYEGVLGGDPSMIRENTIVISVPRDGEIYLGRERTAAADLAARLTGLMTARSEAERVVYINADSNVRYDTVIEILDIIRQNGNYPVALVGRKGNTVNVP